MKKLKTTKWDSAHHLRNEVEIAHYLEAAMEDGDPTVLAHALGVVARAKGMTRVARESGLAREALYRALSPTGNPSFATVLKVAKALGVRFKLAVEAH